MLKWIFFDIGSTLVDEKKSYWAFAERCSSCLKTVGVNITAQNFFDKMSEISARGGEPVKEAWEEWAPANLSRPIWSHLLDESYPETLETLAYLSKSYRLGVIANQGKGLEDRLRELGIRPYFEIIVSSSDFGVKKPDLAIFQLALEQAGCHPEESLYIGDRVDNDIVPAKTIGMRTIRILQGLGALTPESSQYPSDMLMTNLSELKNIL